MFAPPRDVRADTVVPGLAFVLHWNRGMMSNLARAGTFVLGLALLGTGAAYGQGADRAARPSPPAVTTQKKLAPLTEAERAREYLKQLINPFSFVESGASAGWGQLRNKPEAWKQGGAGYGRRYASAFGQHVVENTLQFGLASVLHEDNRYRPSGEQAFGPRLTYALESTVESHDEQGNRHISYSRIFGLAGASMISRLWQPHGTEGVGKGAENFAVSVALSAGLNVAREFVPRLMFLAGGGRN